MTILNLFDIERLAKDKLSPLAWAYYATGAEDELTVADNMAAFRRIKLRPRMLVDVRQVDTSTEVMGQKVALPVLIAPTSHQRLAHPDAEFATARAAAAAGTISVFGTGSHYAIEEITQAGGGPTWFQIYCYEPREVTERIIRRVEDAGCQALVITVDASWAARRETQLRASFHLPPGVEIRTLTGLGLRDELITPDLDINAFLGSLRPLTLTWADIAWFRKTTTLPLVIKGIMTPEDALLAVEHGLDGIIVSNHGGRQVDTTVAAIDALPDVVDAVSGKLEVYMDSGVRRGADALKAVALGAKAVLIGRPYLYGLALDGEAGVKQVLDILKVEMEAAMRQLGRPTIAHLDRSMLQRPH